MAPKIAIAAVVAGVVLLVFLTRPKAPTADQLLAMTPAQIAMVNPKLLAKVDAITFEDLSLDQVAALTQAQIEALKAEQITALTERHLSSSVHADVRKIPPAVLFRVASSTLNSLDGSKISQFEPAQGQILLPRLTGLQISMMSPQVIQNLNEENVKSLTTSQMIGLTTNKINEFSSNQMNWLNREQCEAFLTQAKKDAHANRSPLIEFAFWKRFLDLGLKY